MCKTAKRWDPCAPFVSHPPVDEVNVMTRLCQQRKRAGCLVIPVSSHIRMGKVPPANLQNMWSVYLDYIVDEYCQVIMYFYSVTEYCIDSTISNHWQARGHGCWWRHRCYLRRWFVWFSWPVLCIWRPSQERVLPHSPHKYGLSAHSPHS